MKNPWFRSDAPLIAGLSFILGSTALGQFNLFPTTEPEPQTADTVPTESSDSLQPRFVLHARSLTAMATEVQRSHFGVFTTFLLDLLTELGGDQTEGVKLSEMADLLTHTTGWTDTSISLAIFNPDREGRPRWCIKVDWAAKDLVALLQELLASEQGKEIFEAVKMTAHAQSDQEIAVGGTTLCHVTPAGTGQCYITSHSDLTYSAAAPSADAESEGGPPLVSCRLNLTPTEKDSGATFFSSFRALTHVDYSGRVDSDGQWVETVDVAWPPAVGLGAKTVVEKVKQTFFVPDDALGAAVAGSMMIPGLLEGMAGFGPQFMMNNPGQPQMAPGTENSPIASHVDTEICLTVLPGAGFIPVPDLVLQTKVNKPDSMVENLRKAVSKINSDRKAMEQAEPWHEEKYNDRVVFWSDGGGGGGLMPVTMRPVLFFSRESDASGEKERNFLVFAWTSGSAESMVKRWTEFPRSRDRRFLPDSKKTYGQVWIHWKNLYAKLSPYFNLGLSGLTRDVLLPSSEQIESCLPDGLVSLKMKYSGLSLSHRGPIPVGSVAVPGLLAAAIAPEEDAGSDIARERLAARQLKVLFHHCELFHNDMGRWPAEVAELDGYVDFAGNPQLLDIAQSPRQEWREWFGDLFGDGEEEESDESDEEEEDESGSHEIDDDIYVIDWGRESWSLGFAPDTLEHLEKLYIDQDGRIHRVEKTGL